MAEDFDPTGMTVQQLQDAGHDVSLPQQDQPQNQQDSFDPTGMTLDELHASGANISVPGQGKLPAPEGGFASMLRSAAHAVIPTAAAVPGMIAGGEAGFQAGMAAAPFLGPAAPIGPAAGALVGGVIGGMVPGYAAGKVQESALNAMGVNDEAQQQANVKEHPILTGVGELLPMAAAFDIGDVTSKIAQRLLMGGGMGALDVAQQKIRGEQDINWSEAITQAAAGAAFSKPKGFLEPMAKKWASAGKSAGKQIPGVQAGEEFLNKNYPPGRPDLSDYTGATDLNDDKQAVQQVIPTTSPGAGRAADAPPPRTPAPETPSTGFEVEPSAGNDGPQFKPELQPRYPFGRATGQEPSKPFNVGRSPADDPTIMAAMKPVEEQPAPQAAPQAAPQETENPAVGMPPEQQPQEMPSTKGRGLSPEDQETMRVRQLPFDEQLKLLQSGKQEQLPPPAAQVAAMTSKEISRPKLTLPERTQVVRSARQEDDLARAREQAKKQATEKPAGALNEPAVTPAIPAEDGFSKLVKTMAPTAEPAVPKPVPGRFTNMDVSAKTIKVLRATGNEAHAKLADQLDALPPGHDREHEAARVWAAMHSQTGEVPTEIKNIRVRNPEVLNKLEVPGYKNPVTGKPVRTKYVSDAIAYGRIHDINDRLMQNKDLAPKPNETEEQVKARAQNILDTARTEAKAEAQRMTDAANRPGSNLTDTDKKQLLDAAKLVGNGKLPVENYAMSKLMKPPAWRLQRHAKDFLEGKFPENGNVEPHQKFLADEALIRGKPEDYAEFVKNNISEASTAKKTAAASDITYAEVKNAARKVAQGKVEATPGRAIARPTTEEAPDETLGDRLKREKAEDRVLDKLRSMKYEQMADRLEGMPLGDKRDQAFKYAEDQLLKTKKQPMKWDSKRGRYLAPHYNKERNDKLLADAENMHPNDVAKKYGITRARVDAILKKEDYHTYDNPFEATGPEKWAEALVARKNWSKLQPLTVGEAQYENSAAYNLKLLELAKKEKPEVYQHIRNLVDQRRRVMEGLPNRTRQAMAREKFPRPADSLGYDKLNEKILQAGLENVEAAKAAQPEAEKPVLGNVGAILRGETSIPPKEPTEPPSEPPKPEPPKRSPAEYAAELEKRLRSNDAAIKNFTQQSEQVLEKMRKENPELFSPEIYDAKSKDQINALPEELRTGYYDHLKSMEDAKDVLAHNMAEVAPKQMGQLIRNHTGRVLVNGPNTEEYAKYEYSSGRSDDPMLGRNLKANASGAMKERAFNGLEYADGPQAGKVQVITPGTDGFTFWNDYKGTAVKDDNFKFEDGKDYTAPDGQKYKMVQAPEDLIERNALLDNGQPPRYARNLPLSIVKSMRDLVKFGLEEQFFGKIKSDPEFLHNATTDPDDPRVAQFGWKKTDMPTFQHYYMEPGLADFLDDYHQPGFHDDSANYIRGLSQGVTKLIYLFPTVHMMNVAGFGFVQRGAEWLKPGAYRTLAETSANAMKHVMEQDDVIKDMREKGLTLMSGLQGNTMERLGKAAGEAIKANPRSFELMAKVIGTNAADLVRNLYRKSSHYMWTASDVIVVQAVLEKEAQGLSREQAIQEVERVIPNYRIGTHFLGTGDGGRFMAKLMADPATMAFGPYHVGVVRAIGGMIKRSVKSGPGQKEAIGQLAAMAFLATFIKPALDKIAQAVTGNEEAEVRPMGPLTIPENVVKAGLGQKDIGQALRDTFTIPPLASTATSLIRNQNFAGRPIVQPEDVKRAAHGSPTSAARAALAAGQYTARGLVAPYNLAVGGLTENKQSIPGVIRDQLLSINNPTPAAVRYSKLKPKYDLRALKQERKTEKDPMKRAFDTLTR